MRQGASVRVHTPVALNREIEAPETITAQRVSATLKANGKGNQVAMIEFGIIICFYAAHAISASNAQTSQD